MQRMLPLVILRRKKGRKSKSNFSVHVRFALQDNASTILVVSVLLFCLQRVFFSSNGTQ
jgi:hypothetical protein